MIIFRSVAVLMLVFGFMLQSCKHEQQSDFSESASSEAKQVPKDQEPQDQSSIRREQREKEINLFWQGVGIVARASGVPTYLVEWALKQQASVYGSGSSGASYSPLTKSIAIPIINFKQMIRIGQGEITSNLSLYPLGLIYNELFHAWFDQFAQKSEDCVPLIRVMDHQQQFDYGRKAYQVWLPGSRLLSEEAVSELISTMADFLSDQSRKKITPVIPGYEQAKSISSLELTPSHNEGPESKWYNPVELRRVADLRISEELYKMAMKILEVGCSFENN